MSFINGMYDYDDAPSVGLGETRPHPNYVRRGDIIRFSVFISGAFSGAYTLPIPIIGPVLTTGRILTGQASAPVITASYTTAFRQQLDAAGLTVIEVSDAGLGTVGGGRVVGRVQVRGSDYGNIADVGNLIKGIAASVYGGATSVQVGFESQVSGGATGAPGGTFQTGSGGGTKGAATQRNTSLPPLGTQQGLPPGQQPGFWDWLTGGAGNPLASGGIGFGAGALVVGGLLLFVALKD